MQKLVIPPTWHYIRENI